MKAVESEIHFTFYHYPLSMSSIETIVSAIPDLASVTLEQRLSILELYPTDSKASEQRINALQKAEAAIGASEVDATRAAELLQLRKETLQTAEKHRQDEILIKSKKYQDRMDRARSDNAHYTAQEEAMVARLKALTEGTREYAEVCENLDKCRGIITYNECIVLDEEANMEKEAQKVSSAPVKKAANAVQAAAKAVQKAHDARDKACAKAKAAEDAVLRHVFKVYKKTPKAPKPDDPTTLAVRAIDAQIKDLREQAAAIKVEISKLVEDRRRLRPSKKRKAPPADGPDRTPPSPASSPPVSSLNSDPESEMEKDEDNDSA